MTFCKISLAIFMYTTVGTRINNGTKYKLKGIKQRPASKIHTHSHQQKQQIWQQYTCNKISVVKWFKSLVFVTNSPEFDHR